MPNTGRPGTPVRVAALDFGGSSGRVVAGRVGPDVIAIEGLRRFENVPLVERGELHWDLDRLITDPPQDSVSCAATTGSRRSASTRGRATTRSCATSASSNRRTTSANRAP